MYTPNSVFSRAFYAYEKYFMNCHTQLLRFSHTQQCDRAIRDTSKTTYTDTLKTFHFTFFNYPFYITIIDCSVLLLVVQRHILLRQYLVSTDSYRNSAERDMNEI